MEQEAEQSVIQKQLVMMLKEIQKANAKPAEEESEEESLMSNNILMR